MSREDDLKQEIKTLKKHGVDTSEQEAELAKLQGKAAAPASTDGLFDTGLDEDALEEVKSGSDRPVPGKYEAELTAVDTNYTPTAIKFSFTITQPGLWKGFEDAFYSGKDAKSAFKYKNICAAAGIKPVKTARGTMAYNFNELPGKRIFVIYEQEPPKPFTGNDGVERMVSVSKAAKAAPLSGAVSSTGQG